MTDITISLEELEKCAITVFNAYTSKKWNDECLNSWVIVIKGATAASVSDKDLDRGFAKLSEIIFLFTEFGILDLFPTEEYAKLIKMSHEAIVINNQFNRNHLIKIFLDIMDLGPDDGKKLLVLIRKLMEKHTETMKSVMDKTTTN